jgi:hypothetical protein
MTKYVPEEYWKNTIVPKLYPLWDSDRDRLIVFTYYDNDTYHAQRRKFIKDFKTNEFHWVDYEMEQMNNDEAAKLYELFNETFYLVDSLENEEFQKELSQVYAEVASVNWLTIRLARNFLLSETDWVFSEDSVASDEEKSLWKKYRKALRDLPSSVTDYNPGAVKFPINPKMYKELYIEANPGVEYLEREDQFVTLGQHYLTTFKEKMVRYLIVSETTEQAYFDSFMQKLKEQPDLSNFPAPPRFTQESNYSDQLDQLLEHVRNEELGWKENFKVVKQLTEELKTEAESLRQITGGAENA